VTYMRVTRDQRGYENTFLLHTPRPGERPRILYWYRTAPGIRVGRIPLDEDAIRSIEEQHPDIEFDWPQLIEEASMTPPDVERRPERRRRPTRPREAGVDEPLSDETIVPEAVPEIEEARLDTPDEPLVEIVPTRAEPSPNPLLEQLVGREIAHRLRSRYAELSARIRELPQSDATRAALQLRAEALDPDRWLTMEAILHGVQHADRLFDELRPDIE
jgi:hypothetical protein